MDDLPSLDRMPLTPESSVPWASVFLGSVFEDHTVGPVWWLVHPTARRRLAELSGLGLDDQQLDALTVAAADPAPTWAEDHEAWLALDEWIVGMLHFNLEGYDQETWGTFEHPSPHALDIEDLWVVPIPESGVLEAGEPTFGYRISMKYDPMVEGGNSASWYLAGIKGELWI